MDVTCERCGTEYEFDETLVSDRGTTVKCTNCGHLFKVFRGGAPGPGPTSPPEARSWTLKTREGVRAIHSLKELQRLIAEGHAAEDDLLSRGGEGEKRLGDIAELAPFFASARAAAVVPKTDRRDPTLRGLPRPAEARKGTIMGVGGRSNVPAPSSVPASTFRDGGEPAAQPSAVALAPAAPPPAAPPPAAPPSAAPPESTAPAPRPGPSAGPPRREPTASRPASQRPPSAAPPPAAVPRAPALPRELAATQRLDAEPERPVSLASRGLAPTAAPTSEAPPRPQGLATRGLAPSGLDPDRPTRPQGLESRGVQPTSRRPVSDPPAPLRLEEEDDLPVVPRRSASGLWVGLVLVAALGLGVALGWDRIQALLSPPESGAAPFVATGDARLAEDHDEAYRGAAGEYTKALALDEHDVRALVGLSRAHALLAQNRLFAAMDLDARAATDPAASGEAAALRREATEHTGTAREHAEAAVRIGTGGADAEVALADALRLAGDPLARSRLDRARTLEPTPSAEALRVDALLSAEGAGLLAAGLPGAVALAEQAVAEDPGLLRARLLLARAHLAAGNAAAARAQLQAVLTRAAEHPVAAPMFAGLDAPIAAPDAGLAAPSPPVPPVAPPTAAAPSEPAPAPTGEGSAGAGGSGGGSSSGAGRSYDELVALAQATLDDDGPRRARPLFEQALALRPSGPEALGGLGACLLGEHRTTEAISRLRAAAAAGYTEALIGLGQAYRETHEYDRALEVYEEYLERSPRGRNRSVAEYQADALRRRGATSGGARPPEPAPEAAPETPPTPAGTLPAPEGTTEPPPSDTPAVEAAP